MNARRHARAGGRARARGIVSLEFVLIMPFLLMMLFGIVDASMVLCDKAVLTNAAGEAARQGVMLRATPYKLADINSVVLNYTTNSLVTSGTPASPGVTISPVAGCQTSGSGIALKVNVSYTYRGMVLGSAFSALTGPITINATAVKYCE
jgi:Flp pilus assembly protein TadG